MKAVKYSASAVFACMFIFLPFAYPKEVHAFLKGFGGKVIYTQPCIYPTGAFMITAKPVLGSPINEIWLPPPGTLTFLEGPPALPGQWMLGTLLAPADCITALWPNFRFFTAPIIQIIGTSLPSPL